jgi:hypothetical protein
LTYPVSQISPSDHAEPTKLHDDTENIGQSIECESEEPLISEDERDPTPVSEDDLSNEGSEGKSCSQNETLDYDKSVSDTSQSQLEEGGDEDNADDDYHYVNVFSDSVEEESAPAEGQQEEKDNQCDNETLSEEYDENEASGELEEPHNKTTLLEETEEGPSNVVECYEGK